jgi:hypothetical protein
VSIDPRWLPITVGKAKVIEGGGFSIWGRAFVMSDGWVPVWNSLN